MHIYLIANSETGKYYVGQHKGNNLKKYLQTKLSHANSNKYKGKSHLFASMRKHPKEVWSIHPLISPLTTKTELDYWERFFIATFKARDVDFGYNICPGGEGHGFGYVPWNKGKTGLLSLEARQKISEARRRQVFPADWGAKISRANWGNKRKPFTEEQVLHCSLGKKKVSNPSPNTLAQRKCREKRREVRFGLSEASTRKKRKPLTEEQRRRCVVAQAKYVRPDPSPVTLAMRRNREKKRQEGTE